MKSRFTHVVFLHGTGELPNGAVAQLEDILKSTYPDVKFFRPYIPDLPTDEAFVLLKQFLPALKPGALLIGTGRGGLLAAKLQKSFPALDFHVVAINAPTHDGYVTAGRLHLNRVALYSSQYAPIANRCNWRTISPLAFDLDWLKSGKNHFHALCYLISGYMQGNDMGDTVKRLFPTPTA
jgi:hypothetical protein